MIQLPENKEKTRIYLVYSALFLKDTLFFYNIQFFHSIF